MNTCKLWFSLLVAVALLLPAGFAFSQSRMADIDDAKSLVESNPTFNNRLRLGTLQYLQGVDYLKAGDLSNAIDSMQAGVWTFEDGKGQIPETHPAFEVARYGLAYALLKNGSTYESRTVLEQLVNASPDFGKARYLLGVALMSTPGEQSQQQGIAVLSKLAQDGRAPYKDMGAHAATRYAYDLSTLVYAQGNAEGALQTLNSATDEVGFDAGANDAENNSVHFGAGIYRRDTGDTFGALDHLEAVHNADANYQLANGVAASGVLANMYYAAALAQLQDGGDSANQTAVGLLENAASTGDPDALDVQHGLAVAYTRLGENDKALDALKKIVAKDPSYYNKVKKQ